MSKSSVNNLYMAADGKASFGFDICTPFRLARNCVIYEIVTDPSPPIDYGLLSTHDLAA